MSPFVRIAALLIIVFSLSETKACQCPVTELSRAECNKYQVIFHGTVTAVKTCGDRPGEAVFSIGELFQGTIPSTFTILFDCDDPCATGFNPGEEWIIYCNHKQVVNGKMDWCSRSRKYFTNRREDFYETNTGVEFHDELNFLRSELGLLRPVTQEQPASGNRNIHPNTTQTIVVLIASLLGIVLFYWLFNRFFK